MEPNPYFALVSPLAHGGQQNFSFTYQSNQPLAIGSIATIPLRNSTSLGVVVGASKKPTFSTKSVIDVLDIKLPLHLVELAQWMHVYYQANAKSIWQTFLPSGLTKKRRTSNKLINKFSLPKQTHELSSEQIAALETIKSLHPKPMLIHGITGSGKTELYLRLTTQALAQGKSVILLVPEITLAPQLVAVFSATFGEIIIATHSGMTESSRHQAWQEALRSIQPRIIIGPRSSLFLPLANLGLIIIDECHETSYKQDQSPRYQADIVAGKLASLSGAQLILGSATPSLNQFYLAKHNRLGFAKLTARPNLQPLPNTTIIDLRDKKVASKSRFITQPLLSALTTTLQEGRQSLLFINRRGSASSQVCGDCGTVSLCPNCLLPLTFHADQMSMICHYCNYRVQPNPICSDCSSMNLRYLGGGTKRIESEIAQLLPTARLARLDRDSANPNHINAVYKGLHERTIDILIGTQMIAKGLNIPNLDTVGIVSADTMLHLPDFTASERTFSLITQVSGRAGRGDRPGQVIIQTYSPNHPAIMGAATHNYEAFADSELSQRKLLQYPPFVFLLKLTCRGTSNQVTQDKAAKLVTSLKKIPKISLLGPAPAFIEQQNNIFQWQVIVKSKQRTVLTDIVQTLPANWTSDLDPINLL